MSQVTLGDSAGGNLVTALSLMLKKAGDVPLPVGNIMVSPWLDLSCSYSKDSPNLSSDYIGAGMDKIQVSFIYL